MENNNSQQLPQINPEQAAIKQFRWDEYQRKFGHKAEERINQQNPSPQGLFTVKLQGIARQLVEQASAITNEKKKGDINNADYAAKMAVIKRSVGELGGFAKSVKSAMQLYNASLKNGTLSYGMDQFGEGVLQALNKGTVNIEVDEDGRALLKGKAINPLQGEFDVNIYDIPNVPKVVNKIAPIDPLLDKFSRTLGRGTNGKPVLIIDKEGNKMYDTGPYENHKAAVLKYAQNALAKMGPRGIRSYLADHVQLPQSQVKALMEETSFTDPNSGTEWDNRGSAEAYTIMDKYLGDTYQRSKEPHPETFAKFAKQGAQKIADAKGVPLEEVTTLTESMTNNPNTQQQLFPPTITPPSITEEVAVEETPSGGVNVAELIKKYS
tara:strand:+ start:274 stop:1413 length:1140 start_codon:yes stop_codon:yes gene_type:complete